MAMATSHIPTERKATPEHPCPICGGHFKIPDGRHERCTGYLSADGQYYHCTRPEYAGNLTPSDAAHATYAHRLHGPCKCGKTHGEAIITSLHQKSDKQQQEHVIAEYPYYDAEGNLIYKVVRYEPKTFRPYRYEKGQWILGLGSVKRVLYRLPDLLKNPQATVYFVEGEKDVETLRLRGIVATTTQGGAGSFKHTAGIAEVLHGRQVVILPDNDDAGERYAEEIASHLKGIAKSLRIVHLPKDSGKDVSDFFAQGGTIPALTELIEATPEWGRPPLRYHLMTDIEVQASPPLTWLIHKVLPEGSQSAIYGEPWTGKSFFALDLAMRVTLGMPWVGHPVKPGCAVYIAAEGKLGLSLRIKAWKLAHRVPFTQSVPLYVLGEAVPLLQPDRVGDLLAALRSLPEPPKLIIFDTLSRMMDGGEENSNDDMNKVANAGVLLQKETGAHVMFVHHKPKGGNSMRGGSALFGAVDTAIELTKEEATPFVTIACRKQKDGADPFESYTLRLTPVQLETDLSSCVLTGTFEEDRRSMFGPSTLRCLYTLLQQFGQEGATFTEWMSAANVVKSTFADACKPLFDQGFIERPAERGRGAKYLPTRTAWDWYKDGQIDLDIKEGTEMVRTNAVPIRTYEEDE